MKSIPNEWKVLLRQFPFGVLNPTGIVKIFIYQAVLQENFPVTQIAKDMWNHELGINITNDEWATMYINTMSLTKSTRLRFFQYRLLNRGLVTNVLRSKWDPNVSSLCTYCSHALETVMHLLWFCPVAQNYGTTVRNVILNDYKGLHADLINMCILITKQYIRFKMFECKNEFYCLGTKIL